MSSILTTQRLLGRALPIHGDRIAIVEGRHRITYRQLAERSARLANALLGQGAGPLRPTAILLPNCAEYIEADVACARGGITRVGISERLSADECTYILEHSESTVLITTLELLERVSDEVPESLRFVLVVNRPEGTPVGRVRGATVLAYEDALHAASGSLQHDPVGPEAPGFIFYTSGTTGRPKGAAHSQGGRVAAMVNMLSAELRLTRESVMVHAGGLTHGSGSKVLAFLAVGGRNVVLRDFDPEAVADAIERENGTHTFLVPTMIQRLVESGPRVGKSVRSLHQISFGGSPITPALFNRAIEAFGPILTQVYGSCEAPHPVTVLHPEDYYPDGMCQASALESAGRASWSTDIRVVEDDVDSDPGIAGELLVRSNYLMTGYWADAAATAEVMTPDGWYRTGDVASVDAGGLVTFRDRKRDVIISGGLNIYPSEVERVLAEHPHVQQVAVVGYPDKEWGESVIAYVVPSTPGAVSTTELTGWVRERLASYKKPKRIEFRENLPLGSTGKVLKAELRAALWQGRERQVH